MTRVVEFEGRVRVGLDERASVAAPSIEALYPSTVVLPETATAHFSVEGVGDQSFRVRACAPKGVMDGAGDGGDPSDPVDYSDWVELMAGLEGLISRMILEEQQDRVHLHGAAALDTVGAILVLGQSGAGKSSLALAWSQMGLPLYGDDVVLVGAGGTLEPHRRLIKSDVGRLAEHGIPPRETLAFRTGASEIWFDPVTAGGWAEAAAVPRLIARVTRDPGCSGGTMSPLSPPEVLQALVASAFPTGVSDPGAMLDLLIPMAEQARGVDLTFESTSTAASEMVQLLRSR